MNALDYRDSNNPQNRILRQQRGLYEGLFYRRNRWRWAFRDDCRYRKNRLHELLAQLGWPLDNRRVFEIGFGTGDLLFQFPSSCTLMGTELSRDAVDAIGQDPRLQYYKDHWFRPLAPDGSVPLPEQPVDLLMSSHVLEHVPDDHGMLSDAVTCLRPGGLSIHFVPIEPPGFDPKHIRTYTVESLVELQKGLGLEVLHAEANYHINWGPFRAVDSLIRQHSSKMAALEALHNLSLMVISYPLTRGIEELLLQAGAKGTQAVVIARKPM